MTTTNDLFTTVKNPLANDRVYGYLGFHGRKLTAGSHYTQFGNLVDFIAHNKRKSDALQRDLLANKIQLTSTPKPVLRDNTTHAVKALDLAATVLGVLDPSWGAYTDS